MYMNIKYKFAATGLVYGKYWGGGAGAYEATKVVADTKDKLMQKVNELLKSGGLDSGMGYEQLKGALLNIETITTIDVDGKEFTNSEYDNEFIGDLTAQEQDFLIDCQYN